MTQRNWSWEAKQLLPHLAGMLGSGVTVQAGGGGSMVAHALNSTTWHTGTLAQSQAPWAVTNTVYEAHVANVNAHHARQHALSDSAAHSGLLPWAWLDKTGASLADLPTRLYADLQTRTHSIIGSDHSIGGGDWDVVMNVGTSTPGLRTPSYDVSGGETALLRSFLGALTVNSITAAGTTPRVRTPLIDTLSGDLTLAPQSGITTLVGLHASVRVRSPLLDTASGNMAISPAVDVVLSPAVDVVLNPGGWVELTNGKTLRTQSFASGFVGNGLRIDQGVSVAGQTTLEVDNVWVRGRLHVYELLIHQIRATNGSIFVSNTGKVTAVNGSGPYTLTTDPEHGFAVGDLIRAQRFTGTGVYQCNLQVTSVTNSKVFVATLSSGDVPFPGMDFVRLGSASDANRRGGLYLSADDSGAPFMDIFDGVSSFATWGTAGVIKTRLGKLDGLGLPGSYTSEYGLFAGNGTTDASAYIRLSNKTNRLNNLPLEWWNGGAKVVSIDSTDGLVMQTATAYADPRSVTWKSGATKIADAAAYSNPGFGRQVGLGVYQSSATDLSIIYLNATNTSSKWPYIVLTAQRNTAGVAEDVSVYIGSVPALSFTGVYIDHNAKISGTLAVTGAQTFAGAATFGGSVSAASYGSFTGGQAIASAAAPYYGFCVRADNAGAWARVHRFHTSGGALLGGYWAYGPANSVEYFAIGADYYTSAAIAKFYPATEATVLSGALTVAGLLTAQNVVTLASYLSSSTATLGLMRENHATWTLLDTPSGDSLLRFGYQRTAGGNSYIDFYADPAAGTTISGRWIRWAGVNGAMDFYNRGTGLMTFAQLSAADMRFQTSNLTRLTISATGNVSLNTAGAQMTAPNFDATTAYERDGVRGGIFIPLPSGGYLVDTGGTTWNGGTAKAAGTYTFDLQAAANGSIPADAIAILCSMMGKWTAANDGYYTILAPAGGTFSMVVRAQAGNVTFDQTGIVLLGTNGDITATVAGAVSNTWPLIRIHGYFI